MSDAAEACDPVRLLLSANGRMSSTLRRAPRRPRAGSAHVLLLRATRAGADGCLDVQTRLGGHASVSGEPQRTDEPSAALLFAIHGLQSARSRWLVRIRRGRGDRLDSAIGVENCRCVVAHRNILESSRDSDDKPMAKVETVSYASPYLDAPGGCFVADLTAWLNIRRNVVRDSGSKTLTGPNREIVA